MKYLLVFNKNLYKYFIPFGKIGKQNISVVIIFLIILQLYESFDKKISLGNFTFIIVLFSLTVHLVP